MILFTVLNSLLLSIITGVVIAEIKIRKREKAYQSEKNAAFLIALDFLKQKNIDNAIIMDDIIKDLQLLSKRHNDLPCAKNNGSKEDLIEDIKKLVTDNLPPHLKAKMRVSVFNQEGEHLDNLRNIARDIAKDVFFDKMPKEIRNAIDFVELCKQKPVNMDKIRLMVKTLEKDALKPVLDILIDSQEYEAAKIVSVEIENITP
jgi:hypothetical protein